MRLRKKQREFLIQKVAEGLDTGEINKLAEKFKPPFKVTRQQVDHYRKTRGVKIDEIIEADETNALATGLALKENRVQLLQDLADLLKNDIFEKQLVWLDQAKGLGSGKNFERYDFQEFNAAEIAQLRGLLDDIAAEVGDRVRRQELTGKGGKPLIPDCKAVDLSGLSEEELDAVEKARDALDRAAGVSANAAVKG